MFIKYLIKRFKDKREYINSIIEENKNMDKKIIEARQEIAWLKTVVTMNRYNSADTILNITNRKLDEIEEILER